MDAPFPPNFMEEVDKFFANLPDNRADARQAVIDSPLMYPLQRVAEMGWMMSTARCDGLRAGGCVFEIGSDKGGSLYWWCCEVAAKSGPEQRGKVIACEIRGTPYSAHFERAFPNIDFLWLDCESSVNVKSVAKVQEWLFERDAKIDVLFVDGDKLLMRQDVHNYWPLVRQGGLVFVHDTLDKVPGDDFFDLVKTMKRDFEVFVDRSESRAAMEREAKGEPVLTPHEGWLRHWKGDSCGVGLIHRT